MHAQSHRIFPPPPSPLPLASITMKWGLVLSLLLPHVAASLPPYKRFVSLLIYLPEAA